MSCEIFLNYGGGLQYDDTGDLILAFDTATSPTATFQRLTRLMLTRARIINPQTRLYSKPDDIFNPDWGAGLPRFVHRNLTPAVKTEMQQRILPEVCKDPGCNPSPPPVLTFNQSFGQLSVALSFTTLDGQRQTTPPVPILVSQ